MTLAFDFPAAAPGAPPETAPRRRTTWHAFGKWNWKGAYAPECNRWAHMCVLASCDPVAWQRHFNLHDVAGQGVLEVKDLPVRGICTRCSFANPRNRFGLEVAILLLHLGGCVLVSFNGKSRTLEGRAMDRFTILTWVAVKKGQSNQWLLMVVLPQHF